MFQVVTQEAGTGEWFALVEYHGESAEQWDAACSLADTLRQLGLHALATKETGAHGMNGKRVSSEAGDRG